MDSGVFCTEWETGCIVTVIREHAETRNYYSDKEGGSLPKP